MSLFAAFFIYSTCHVSMFLFLDFCIIILTKSLIPVLTLILTLINPNPASKNRKLYQPLNRDSYTARNLTGLLQAVDFTGLRQVVNKSRQVCWFRQAVIGLREQVCRKLFTTEP